MGREFIGLPVRVDPRYLQSQLGQDRFLIFALDHKIGGRFLDIGAGEPWYLSNTLAIEKALGWRGVLCDIAYQSEHMRLRDSDVTGDAFGVNWPGTCKSFAIDGRIDFLSLDLEPPALTERLLNLLPLDSIRFSIMCIEHDGYRNDDGEYGDGTDRRDRMRSLLRSHGYELFANVGCNGELFDDWWIDPQVIDAGDLNRRIDAALGSTS